MSLCDAVWRDSLKPLRAKTIGGGAMNITIESFRAVVADISLRLRPAPSSFCLPDTRLCLVASGSFVACSRGFNRAAPPAADPNRSLASGSLNPNSILPWGTQVSRVLLMEHGLIGTTLLPRWFRAVNCAGRLVLQPLRLAPGNRKLVLNRVHSPSRTGRKRFFGDDHHALLRCGYGPS